MKQLKGMESARAWMDYSEWLNLQSLQHPAIFEKIVPEIRKELDIEGNEAFEKWMEETGSVLQAEWSEASKGCIPQGEEG